MNWPKALVEELASRRCIIFLGAGASAGCVSSIDSTSPPRWEQYLERFISLMTSVTDRPIINDYLGKEKFLEAAEVIKKNVPTAEFTRFLRDVFVAPRFSPSIIHEAVVDIDPKIVITTNYDDIYENYCKGFGGLYNVSKYYENHIVSDLRSTARLIIKAHGCVTDASKTILTKSEYFKARQEYPNFYKVLDALFLTHTILFIGYSLNDPDVQLVLENVNIAAPNSHPHYFVAESGINDTIKAAYKETYNIEFIEFQAKNYRELNEGMIDLKDEVLALRQLNPSI